VAKRALSGNKYVRGLVPPLVQYGDCFFQQDDHGSLCKSEMVAAAHALGAATTNTNSYLPQLVDCKYLVGGKEQKEARQSFEPRIWFNKRGLFGRFAIGKDTSGD
jgi:hypothetical protein